MQRGQLLFFLFAILSHPGVALKLAVSPGPKDMNCCFGDTNVFKNQTNNELSDVLVVIAATAGSDVTWLQRQPYNAIVVSDFAEPGKRRHHGYEAGSYLHYIATYYEQLPERLIFMHDHETAWEINNQSQILSSIKPFQYDYMGLGQLWAIDLKEEHQGQARDFLKSVVKDERVLAQWPAERVTEKFSYPMGGSFVVAKQRIRSLDQKTWKRIFDWAQGQPSKHAACVLEWTWHMVLGEPSEMKIPWSSDFCPTDPGVCKRHCAHGTISEDRLKMCSAVEHQ